MSRYFYCLGGITSCFLVQYPNCKQADKKVMVQKKFLYINILHYICMFSPASYSWCSIILKYIFKIIALYQVAKGRLS